MIISNINWLSKQLRFYCWHFKRDLDQRQRQELIELLYEQHFERLTSKIKILIQSNITDCKQQVGKLLFEHCMSRNRRHQLIQLIESGLVDINVRLDNYGRTLLHRSAYNLDVELVRILIEQGVNIKLRDYAGNTALHIAIQSYRNGSIIYGDGPDVAQNLTSIMTLLLKADRSLQDERYKRKKLKLSLTESDFHKLSNLEKQQKNHQKFINNDQLEYASQSPPAISGYHVEKETVINSESHQKIKLEQSTEHMHRQNAYNKNQEHSKQSCYPVEYTEKINPMLLEDTSNLIDTKNVFGRTPLHYIVLVVGEKYLAHFVKLLINFGADVEITDTKLRTPLYCLVRRACPLREKCLAITHLLETGCDDLGLAVDPSLHFNEKTIESLEQNQSSMMQTNYENPVEPIFIKSTYKRVPSLKHIVRLRLIRLQDEKTKLRRQTRISLPYPLPTSLNTYVNRRVLDQTELF